MSKNMILFLLLFNITNLKARTYEFTIEMDKGQLWEMSLSQKLKFDSFLTNELELLKQETRDLHWPEVTDETNFKLAMLESVIPATDKYKNRKFQCNFLNKVTTLATEDVAEKLKTITKNGSLCIQMDMPKEEWISWTQKLVSFFWDEKWIKVGASALSLKDLIKEKVGNEIFQETKIIVAENLQFDGYGWGFSKKELAHFKSNSILLKYNQIIQKLNPDSVKPFTLLGADAQEFLQDDRFSNIGMMQPGNSIYVASDFAPADIIELLAHEYGHVYHGFLTEEVIWDKDNYVLKRSYNRVHEEGVAEAFSWMLLRDIYANYPEIKLLHLAKLKLFMYSRSKDPHLVGAAAFFEIFHSDNLGTFDELQEFATNLSLSDYLKYTDLSHVLIDKGYAGKDILPVSFED